MDVSQALNVMNFISVYAIGMIFVFLVFVVILSDGLLTHEVKRAFTT